MERGENTQNKLIVVLAVISVMVFAIAIMIGAISSRNSGASSEVVSGENVSSEITSDAFLKQENTSGTDGLKKEDKDAWKLLVASRKNIVSDYVPQVKEIPSYYTEESGMKFDERAFDDLQSMLYAAEYDGVYLNILNAYTTNLYQDTMYKNKVAYYINQGYKQQEAEEYASAEVPPAGGSDHNLALACDFNYLDVYYENSDELVWLRENAERFGFVLRYPQGKENITGVVYEPWHFRYVGKENAEKMNEMGVCLEEYVEYSKN